MGNICTNEAGDKEARQRNTEIEKQLLREKKLYEEEIKILLLGAGESGKSTIAKQMKIIHLAGFSEEEKQSYKPVVYHNVLKAAQTLIEEAIQRNLELEADNEENARLINEISLIGQIQYTPEIAHAITAIWKDPAIRETFEHSSEYQLSDSAPYFLDNCERFHEPSYVPTELDILRVRAKTTGIVETIFSVKRKKFRMIDVGGQRNERKKWIHCFQDVTAIIFCVAMSEYDLVLEEDSDVNRMHESLKLFGDIINNMWFDSTSIILFLNKRDLFEEKIKKTDLKVCFPVYEGGKSFENGKKYIKNKFTEKNKTNKRTIYTHYTCATDTNNIKFVFQAVEDIFLTQNLQEMGFGY